MLDANTKKACKDDPSIREIKIRNIEHAIEQAELMIKESKMSQEELIFLKRKISDSRQDLEILYLMKKCQQCFFLISLVKILTKKLKLLGRHQPYLILMVTKI